LNLSARDRTCSHDVARHQRRIHYGGRPIARISTLNRNGTVHNAHARHAALRSLIGLLRKSCYHAERHSEQYASASHSQFPTLETATGLPIPIQLIYKIL
jgi:hypothetical protein